MSTLASGDLVDLVQKHDAARLHSLHGRAVDRVHVDQAAFFFLHQVVECVADLHLALLGAAPEYVGQHVLEVHLHVLKVLVRDDAELRRIALTHVDFHHAVVQLAFAELLAQFFPGALMTLRTRQLPLPVLRRRRGRQRRQQDIEQALFGVHLRLVFHFFQALFAHHVDRYLHQVPDHRFHIAPNISHLGKFRGLHLQKRRIGQLRQAARNLRFAHARGPDHDDVLGHDVVGHVGGQLLPALTIAQRDRHCALGSALAHHVLVKLSHNLARRKLVERQILFFSGSGEKDRHGVCGLGSSLR